MAARGQEEKKRFIQELISKFEGAYEFDTNKVVLIPFEGVGLKCTITVAKEGAVAKKDVQPTSVAAPTEQEIKDLEEFINSLSDTLPF